jgi:hypothetical protein
MANASSRVIAALAATTIWTAPAVRAENPADAQFGNVHFPTSCNDLAQRRFDRAMRYQHSFWYQPAREIFGETLAADPECAISQWGIALTLLLNPHTVPPKENLALGVAALEKAKAIGAKSERERDYIDALSAFYSDYDNRRHDERVQAYAKAMERLASRYPDDDEAQIGYAITLNVAASPHDKTYANQLKGASILEPIFRRQPRHPGVAHYLIHLYDYPEIAEKGLEAARRYADIAPAAPHAQHMPSHIFTRVGYWKESISSNAASARAAKAGKEPHDQLHAMDYLVYAHLQLAQDKEARAAVDEMVAVKGYNPAIRTGAYAVAASRARYVVERGDWREAARLPVEPSRFAYVDAITHFARALGAARSGELEPAKADIARLAELRDQLRQANEAYWAEQVDIQRQVATAWLLNAENKPDEALRAIAAAAEAEDKTEKSVVTPGPLAPARELQGEMLLDRGYAPEAVGAFEATLRKEPNRFRATMGAAKASEQAGDLEKARRYHARIAALAENGETSRSEVAGAVAFLRRN